MKFDLAKLRFEHLRIEQLWFFGDSPDGAITIHGGAVSDLNVGVYWAGRMQNGEIPAVKRLRFKPNPKPQVDEKTPSQRGRKIA